jgi:hypothetical protein
MLRNYFELFEAADAVVIKDAYRAPSRFLHADRSSALFGTFTEAYEVLGGPQERSGYSQSLTGSTSPRGTAPPSTPVPGPHSGAADRMVQTTSTDRARATNIGSFGTAGWPDGAFEYPNGVATDKRAHVHITDREDKRVLAWSF